MKPIQEGQTHTESMDIEAAFSAERYGNAGFPVLATPALVGMFEKAAIGLLRPFMDDRDGSVGTKVSIEHLAPTPLGWKVAVVARLVKIDRKRLVFELEAHDNKELIARCMHERYLVQLPGFLDKLQAKAASKV